MSSRHTEYKPKVAAGQPIAQVRAERNDGGRIMPQPPRRSSDTLIGAIAAASGWEAMALPLGEVCSLEVRRFERIQDGRMAILIGAM